MSGKSPTAEGFVSHKIAERMLVGIYALTLSSGKIPSVECTYTVLRVGKIPSSKGPTPSGENYSNRVVSNGGNPINGTSRHNLLSERNPISERTDSEWGKFQ